MSEELNEYTQWKIERFRMNSIDPDKQTWKFSTRSMIGLIGFVGGISVAGWAGYHGITWRLDKIEALQLAAQKREWNQYQMKDFAYDLERLNRGIARKDGQDGLIIPEITLRPISVDGLMKPISVVRNP